MDQQTIDELPYLPESRHFYYAPNDTRAVRKPLPLYTAEQMRIYARVALATQQPIIGYTWTYQGMQHFTGRRDVAEEIARTATELGVPVAVRPVCIAGDTICKGGN